ncbi:di-trans,poly-cis-decaprenylcistransferase [Microbacteriaceae bacterium]|nr:di-trans,poly-cis-decaprenylcistransferase [Candidatus Saccharibacteria bacterium]
MDNNSLPTHVGYIVDGNRRWAKSRGLPGFEGHRAGYHTLKDILLETVHSGVFYVSAFVFSTENWKRSEKEVGNLMSLLLRVLKTDAHIFVDNNVKMRVLGSREGLSKNILKAIDETENLTKDMTGGEILLCLNYGGQQEITEAVKDIVREGQNPDTITPDTIASHLYAPDVPPCDLIVRTSGEQRLSNFMLWRSAYSELLFIDTLWPDMTKHDVTAILKEYTRRKRRFGG